MKVCLISFHVLKGIQFWGLCLWMVVGDGFIYRLHCGDQIVMKNCYFNVMGSIFFSRHKETISFIKKICESHQKASNGYLWLWLLLGWGSGHCWY